MKSIYEQNHQRSTLSYTTHTNCVRTSLQMGFHCASARDARDHTPEKLHQKIWMGVLNNDRYVQATYRPFRISEDMIALTLLGAMFSKVVVTWLLSGLWV